MAQGRRAALTLSVSRWNTGSGAAATLRPLVPLPVRTPPPLGPCPSRPQASGPRIVDSLGLDQAQEVNGYVLFSLEEQVFWTLSSVS